MRRYLGAFLLASVLAVPATTILRADDEHEEHERKEHRAKRYYDTDSRDWHEWNEHEEQAWRRYWDERHTPYRNWEKAKRRTPRVLAVAS
jgi:hypothetical protein